MAENGSNEKKRDIKFYILTAIIALCVGGVFGWLINEWTPKSVEKPIFEYAENVEMGGYTLTKVTANGNKTVMIPSEYNGEDVVEIGNAAFFANEELEEVIIPASVEKIGVQAFDRCKNLKEIVIPNSVATIGVQAFKDCTSLTYVRIGKNVADVGLDTFSGCSSLKEIAVHKDNVDYESVDGNLYLSSSISNMETLVQYAIGKAETSFSVPDGVVHIRSYAFTNSKLENIILPDSLKSVGGFYNCSKLISVTIPESVVSVGNFAGSTNLRTVTLPSGLKYVPSFMGCSSLESLVIPENVTKIGQNTFKDCAALTSITIPLHVVKIGITAFSGCKNLTRVVFENTAYWTAECAGRDTVEFTKAELSDPETAAKYLTDTYRYYDWAQ